MIEIDNESELVDIDVERVLEGILSFRTRGIPFKEDVGNEGHYVLEAELIRLGIYVGTLYEDGKIVQFPSAYIEVKVENKNRSHVLVDYINENSNICLPILKEYSDGELEKRILGSILNLLEGLLDEKVYTGIYRKKASFLYPLGGGYHLYYKKYFWFSGKSFGDLGTALAEGRFKPITVEDLKQPGKSF